MKRDSKRKINYLVVSIFVLVIFATTVAYAAVTQRLTVSGEVNRKGGTWNIYMSNPVLYQKTGSAGSSELELVDSTTWHVSAYLTEPGDSIVYTFVVNNAGTIDAKLSSWNFVNSSSFQSLINQGIISANITYNDGTALNTTNVLSAKGSNTLKLTLKYNEAITTDDQFISFNLKLVYTQSAT